MKTVFITGASGGIGRAAAVLFQKNGWNVAAAMRTPENENELNKIGNVKCYKSDVSDIGSIRLSVQSAINDFGCIDVLVNNAGKYETNPLEMTSADQINDIIGTNIIGYINMMTILIPYFRARKEGLIINISSACGRMTFPYQSLYQCSKWAVEGLSEGLQHELDLLNVRIKIIEPGMVNTGLYKMTKKLSYDGFPEEYKNNFKSWYTFLLDLINKGDDPEAAARTVFEAASDNSKKLRYVSGKSAKILLLMKSMLPSSLFTNMLRRSWDV
jgi:NADP-dependent 3-hydroxy acid dehydrogenase YdfG